MQRVTNEPSESAITTKINEPAQMTSSFIGDQGWLLFIFSEQRFAPLSHDYAEQQDVRKLWLS